MRLCILIIASLNCLALFQFCPKVSAQQDGFERPPIDYLNTEVHDPIAVLQ